MRLFNREKLLLKVIDELDKKGIHSMTVIVKIPFLLRYEYSVDQYINGFYSFFPYKYGPFSEQLYGDLRHLKNLGLLDKSETNLTEEGKRYVKDNKIGFNNQISHLVERFKGSNDIIKYVYNKYPNFAVKSELNKNKGNDLKIKHFGFYTVGYEKRNIDQFLSVLIENEIQILIDVRNNPFSMNFSFIGNKLKEHLTKVGIRYVHIPELGVESEDRKNLDSKKDYLRLFERYREELPSKRQKVNEIIDLGRKNRIAMMCFERDHSFCHRGVLAEFLRKQKLKVIDV